MTHTETQQAPETTLAHKFRETRFPGALQNRAAMLAGQYPDLAPLITAVAMSGRHVAQSVLEMQEAGIPVARGPYEAMVPVLGPSSSLARKKTSVAAGVSAPEHPAKKTH